MTSNFRKNLFTIIGIICGLLAVFIFRRNLSAEIDILKLVPTGFDIFKSSGSEITNVLSNNPVTGLIASTFFDVINVLLVAILLTAVILTFDLQKKIEFKIILMMLLSTFGIYAIFNLGTQLLITGAFDSKNIAVAEVISRVERIQINDLYDLFRNIGLFGLYFTGVIFTIFLKHAKKLTNYTYIFGLVSNVIGLVYFPLTIYNFSYSYLAIVFAAPFTVIWQMNLVLNLIKQRKKDQEIIRLSSIWK